MSTTRRTILGGALAAPFLAHFSGTASAAVTQEKWGTASDGWVEIRWTSQAYAQLGQYNATFEPITPATWVTEDGRRVGVRFPVRSVTGDPSLDDPRHARGSGELEGGVLVRRLTGQFEVTGLRSTLENEVLSGTCTVDGVENSRQSLVRCDSRQGRLLAAPVPAGRPLPIRIEGVPVYPTPESLDAIRSALGTSPFGVDTVLGYATAEAVYHPPSP